MIDPRLLDMLERVGWYTLSVRTRVGITLLVLLLVYRLRWLVMSYVYVPLRIYRGGTPIVTKDRTRTVDPMFPEPVDPEVQRCLDEHERAVSALGFVEPHATTNDAALPLTSVGVTFEHPDHGDNVLITAMRPPPGVTKPQAGVLSFSSEFADGICLSTSNFPTPRYWPDMPTLDHVRFPDVSDAAELYRLHRIRVAAKRKRIVQTPISRGRSPEQRLVHTKRQALEFYKHLVRCRYYRRTSDGLRPTVRGAVFGAWRHVFPWRHLDQWSLRRRARAVQRLG